MGSRLQLYITDKVTNKKQLCLSTMAPDKDAKVVRLEPEELEKYVRALEVVEDMRQRLVHYRRYGWDRGW